MRKNFIRKKEDFVCAQCEAKVEGTGYTNHCPYCLWSKHVDNTPGDREAACHGMMEPKAILGSTDAYRILHKCIACGIEKYNIVGKNDASEALRAIAEKRETS